MIGGLILLLNSDAVSVLNKAVSTKEERQQELSESQYTHQKEKRGFFENGYAFLFGETAYANLTTPGKSNAQAPELGQPRGTSADVPRGRYGKATRFQQSGGRLDG